MFDFLKKTHKITYASVSFDGTRPYNEDSLKILDTDRRKLFILADGLGGCGDGKLASQTAVDSAEDTGQESTGSGETFLKELFETAQESVTEKKENPEKGMATTMVVLDIEGKTAQWAHVGDSRLYFFRKNRFEAHTKDHSVPQMLVRVGELDPSQIRKHPDRNRLLHSIGYEWSGRPYSIGPETELMEGDAFLLCSDGFWEYIEETEMISLLKKHKDPVSWLEAMRKIVAQRGRDEQQDNYSAICIKID